MANRLFNPITQYLDAAGEPLSGGKLYFYETGTATAASTYDDVALSSANANPVVLDSTGRTGDIFLDPSITYRVKLTDADDVTIWTADDVADPSANVSAAIAVYPGDPNGSVSGVEGTAGGVGSSMVYDSANDVLYVCTQTGTASTAVWTSQTAGSAGLGSANVFTVGQTIRFTDAGTSIGPMLIYDWESSTPAASDVATLWKFMGEDSAGNDQDYARSKVTITDPTNGSEDAVLSWGVITAGTLADELALSGAALYPVTNNGLNLGAASFGFNVGYLETIELGHDTDTTISRLAAGQIGVEGNAIARIKTGSYTGDGTTSKAITGVGFTPKYVRIWPRVTSNAALVVNYETTDTIVDDNASGMAILNDGSVGTSEPISQTNAIIALGSDGFTVDDAGVDGHPNKNGTTYNYLCLG